MSKVAPLIVFGLTLVVGGLYWALWDGARDAFDSILVNDAYYTLIYFIWRIIPVVIIFIGILCLISAGISLRKTTEVYEY